MKHPRLFSALAFLVMAPLLAAISVLTVAGSALAADPVFPPGARIGMTPLVGLVPAKAFTGLETEDRSVKVLIAELPTAAYGEVMNTFKTNPAIAAGAKPESLETSAGTAYYTAETAKNAAGVIRHYSMILSGGTFSGYVDVQVPENATRIYSDDAVRQMLASAVIRKEVPIDEQLALMPFKVDSLGDFKHVRALGATGALLLADGDETAGFEARALHGDRSDAVNADPTRRSRPFRRAGRARHTGDALRADHDVRAGPYRRDGRVRDADRCHQRPGRYPGHAGAMAALRRPGLASDHRQRAARPMGEGLSAFPRGPRRG